jgi:DUF1016 N-terminal domain
LTAPPPAEFDDVLRLIDAARGRAVAAVNKELLDLYWNIGEHISRKIASDGWGQGFVRLLEVLVQEVSVALRPRLGHAPAVRAVLSQEHAMRTIAVWGNLIPFGIIPVPLGLPNPTCHALGDVQQPGKDLVLKVLRLPDIPLGPPRTRGFPRVLGSLSLPKDLKQLLAVTALLDGGCTEVFCLSSGDVVGVEPGDTPQLVEEFRLRNYLDLTRRHRKDGDLIVEVPVRQPAT